MRDQLGPALISFHSIKPIKIRKMKAYFLTVVLCICTWMCLFAQPPLWSVNENDFQFNMTVTSVVLVDFDIENGLGNLLGAFVGGQVRGVAAPIIVNNSAYYFITIYSNSVSGEEVTFQVYLSDQDQTYDALEVLPFQNNDVIGNVSEPYEINISLIDDFPISLDSIPKDTTLTGIDFQIIDLEDYIVSYDNDPITWSTINGIHLMGSVDVNQNLQLEAIDPLWTGTDMIKVIATEMGTPAMFADTHEVIYTILPNYIGPDFTNITLQFPDNMNVFPLSHLDSFTVYEGPCKQYNMDVIPLEGNISNPNWMAPPTGGGSMNLVVKTTYNGEPFNDMGTLSGFVNGTLLGMSDPIIAGGNAFYFLTLANIESGNIQFQFYDPSRMYLHKIDSDISYTNGGSAGSVSDPALIDLSPIEISLASNGAVEATLIKLDFEDIQLVKFYAVDCDYPSKNDSITVSFLTSTCGSITMNMCPGESICAKSPNDLINIVWYKDGQPIAEDSVFSIVMPGEYYYQGITSQNELSIGCSITVEEGMGCTGSFPSINYTYVNEDFSLAINGVIFENITASTIEYYTTWTGNGDGVNWHDESNWSEIKIPCECQHVIIPSSEQVIMQTNQFASIWCIETQMGAGLTIKNGAKLNVIGKL
ncbi:MAG: hypothetical protein ACI86M_002081 [Saprospiraceae bacterium]|jgi:hypothetical protein